MVTGRWVRLFQSQHEFLYVEELSGDESKDIIHVKELVSQLYTQMHLSEWHASREQELLQSIDALKHELAPYDKVCLFLLYTAFTYNHIYIRISASIHVDIQSSLKKTEISIKKHFISKTDENEQ